MLTFKKHDMYGQVLNPGDVCVRPNKNSGAEFCVYKGTVNGNKSKGTFGKFITNHGIVSLKYTNVIFVFDALSERRGKTVELKEMVRRFYEDIR